MLELSCTISYNMIIFLTRKSYTYIVNTNEKYLSDEDCSSALKTFPKIVNTSLVQVLLKPVMINMFGNAPVE